MEMNYNHPNYPTSQAIKHLVKDEENHKIVRLEYPDGVIIVLDMNLEGITIDSNYGFITDGYNLKTNLEHKQLDFKDVL